MVLLRNAVINVSKLAVLGLMPNGGAIRLNVANARKMGVALLGRYRLQHTGCASLRGVSVFDLGLPHRKRMPLRELRMRAGFGVAFRRKMYIFMFLSVIHVPQHLYLFLIRRIICHVPLPNC